MAKEKSLNESQKNRAKNEEKILRGFFTFARGGQRPKKKSGREQESQPLALKGTIRTIEKREMRQTRREKKKTV